MAFFKKQSEPQVERPVKIPINTEGLEIIQSKSEINVGLPVVHKTLGKGVVKEIGTNTVEIDFENYDPKDLLIDICMNKNLLFKQ